MARFKRTHSVAGRLMKKDIHPEYREVVFLDTSCNAKFLTRSTIETRETIEYQGKTYPLSKIEISSASHPVYTGIKHIVDSEGNVKNSVAGSVCALAENLKKTRELQNENFFRKNRRNNVNGIWWMQQIRSLAASPVK